MELTEQLMRALVHRKPKSTFNPSENKPLVEENTVQVLPITPIAPINAATKTEEDTSEEEHKEESTQEAQNTSDDSTQETESQDSAQDSAEESTQEVQDTAEETVEDTVEDTAEDSTQESESQETPTDDTNEETDDTPVTKEQVRQIVFEILSSMGLDEEMAKFSFSGGKIKRRTAADLKKLALNAKRHKRHVKVPLTPAQKKALRKLHNSAAVKRKAQKTKEKAHRKGLY